MTSRAEFVRGPFLLGQTTSQRTQPGVEGSTDGGEGSAPEGVDESLEAFTLLRLELDKEEGDALGLPSPDEALDRKGTLAVGSRQAQLNAGAPGGLTGRGGPRYFHPNGAEVDRLVLALPVARRLGIKMNI